MVYTVAEGKLPAGITLTEDGKLTGTPTAAGEYEVTVQAVATKTTESTNFMGMTQTSVTEDTGTYTFTIIVSE